MFNIIAIAVGTLAVAAVAAIARRSMQKSGNTAESVQPVSSEWLSQRRIHREDSW